MWGQEPPDNNGLPTSLYEHLYSSFAHDECRMQERKARPRRVQSLRKRCPCRAGRRLSGIDVIQGVRLSQAGRRTPLIESAIPAAQVPAPMARWCDALLTPSEAAELLRVSTKTLANWRSSNIGPDYLKLGTAKGSAPVRYAQTAVLNWLRGEPREHTQARHPRKFG